jgi:hypothetical protein
MLNHNHKIVVLLFSILLSSNLRAQELFEPPDGYIYHGVGWGKEAQNHYCDMFSQDHQPLLFQIM